MPVEAMRTSYRSTMAWSLAKKYAAKRDNQVWGILDAKIIRPTGARLAWLHTVEEMLFTTNEWGRARGYLYLAEEGLYFTSETHPGITFIPLVRIQEVTWDDSHEGLAVIFADEYAMGAYSRYWYRLRIPGQTGFSAEVLIKDFLDKLHSAYERTEHPDESLLWPSDGGLGSGVLNPRPPGYGRA